MIDLAQIKVDTAALEAEGRNVKLRRDLINEIERLRTKIIQLENDLHPKCNCPHCTGIPDYYADEPDPNYVSDGMMLLTMIENYDEWTKEEEQA